MKSPAITVATIAITVIVFAFFSLQDELTLVKTATLEKTTLSGCMKRTFDAGKQGVGRVNTQFATSTTIASGHTVVGSYIHPQLKYCEKRLYRDVNVLVHPTDEKRSRMVTFFDFLLVPSLFLLVVCVLFLLILREGPYGKHVPKLINLVFLIAAATGLFHYWKDYETARDFELLGIETIAPSTPKE